MNCFLRTSHVNQKACDASTTITSTILQHRFHSELGRVSLHFSNTLLLLIMAARNLLSVALLSTASAFMSPQYYASRTSMSNSALDSTANAAGNLHGQGACFLPLLQNDDEYIAPRIVQVRMFTCR